MRRKILNLCYVTQQFLHIEEKVIGGDVDLDLLSLFPQELARIIGGIES